MENNHLHVNEISAATKASLKTRVISAIVASIIVIPLIFVGDFGFAAMMLVILGFCIYEFIHCAGKKYSISLYIITFVLAVVMSYWPIIHSLFDAMQSNTLSSWRIYQGFSGLSFPVTALVIGACAIFTVVVWDRYFELRDACYVYTLAVIISIAFQSILYLRYYPVYERHAAGAVTDYFNTYDNLESALLIFYIAIATFMSDTGAYFVGIFFGKHKMNERISPKKTWEGFVGGVVVSTICSFLFAFLFTLNGHPLLGIFDLHHWYYVLILSIIIPFFAVL